MAESKLSNTEIELRLNAFNQQLKEGEKWGLVSGALSKVFIFHDFNQAFSWMTQVAMMAEKIDHHPEWRNVWNKVEISIMTHDVKGITELDFTFIARVENLSQH